MSEKMNLIDLAEAFYKTRDSFSESDIDSIDAWHSVVDKVSCMGCSLKMDGQNVASALLLDRNGEIVLAPKGSKKQQVKHGRIFLVDDDEEDEAPKKPEPKKAAAPPEEAESKKEKSDDSKKIKRPKFRAFDDEDDDEDSIV